MTREELIEKVKTNQKDWFYKLYNHDCEKDLLKEFKIVYDQNFGDGNEYFIAFEFKDLDLIVLLEGTYSSWDSPEWYSVCFAQPYEFKETRYKEVTLDYLRDKKIDTVLNEKN